MSWHGVGIHALLAFALTGIIQLCVTEWLMVILNSCQVWLCLRAADMQLGISRGWWSLVMMACSGKRSKKRQLITSDSSGSGLLGPLYPSLQSGQDGHSHISH